MFPELAGEVDHDTVPFPLMTTPGIACLIRDVVPKIIYAFSFSNRNGPCPSFRLEH